jgi:hypothetical protein
MFPFVGFISYRNFRGNGIRDVYSVNPLVANIGRKNFWGNSTIKKGPVLRDVFEVE